MKKTILAMAAIATIASCSKSESVDVETWNGELIITSGIETRASGTTWAAGDAIGVFMSQTDTDTDTTTAVGLHNTAYITSDDASSTAEFTVDSDNSFVELYYPQSGTVDIAAHYPYNEYATLTTYPVSVADQSSHPAIDFMSSQMLGVEKSKTPLALNFYHLLSQLKVELTPASDGGLSTSDLASATVKVSGTQVTAKATVAYDTINKKPTATFELSGEATDLSLAATSGVATFIVVPQSATVTFTITVANIGVFSVTTSAAAIFSSGDEHIYTISVSRTAAAIDGALITGWGTGTTGESGLMADDI